MRILLTLLLILTLFSFNSCNDECSDTIVNTKYVCPDIDDMPETGGNVNLYIAITAYMPNASDSLQKIRIKNFDFNKKALENFAISNSEFEHIKLSELVNFDSLDMCDEYEFTIKDFLDFENGEISFYDERNANSILLQRYSYGSVEENTWIEAGK